jgi:hypothetical protein
MSQIRRRRLWVDAKLQGSLLSRATLYWVHCLLSVALFAFLWTMLVQRPATSADLIQSFSKQFGPALVGSLALLPLVLLDCLRVSNRLAGPMMRLRREMKALANGEDARPIQLRRDDFWAEVADDWNRIVTRHGSSDRLRADSTPGHPERLQPGGPARSPVRISTPETGAATLSV